MQPAAMPHEDQTAAMPMPDMASAQSPTVPVPPIVSENVIATMVVAPNPAAPKNRSPDVLFCRLAKRAIRLVTAM